DSPHRSPGPVSRCRESGGRSPATESRPRSPSPSLRVRSLESCTHAEGEPHQLPASPAVGARGGVARSGETAIMAVGRHPATSSAQVVVSKLIVDGIRPGKINQNIVTEVVLDRSREHVRLVVGVQPTSKSTVPDVSDRGVVLSRIAGGLEGVSPAEMQGVRLGQPLAGSHPKTKTLPLVLEHQFLRNVSVKVL